MLPTLLLIPGLVLIAACGAAPSDDLALAARGFWTPSSAPLDAASVAPLLGLDPSLLHLGALPAEPDAENLPEHFDAREHWPFCHHSMFRVWDQGRCASDWAIAVASSLADRECSVTGGCYHRSYSAEHLNSCANQCGDCRGGSPSCALAHWVEEGLVSDECYPYSVPPCDHRDINGTWQCPEDGPTPDCKKRCAGDMSIDWGDNLRRGLKHYTVCGERNIMHEVMEFGPCVLGLTVYEDFLSYSSGVYKHVSGSQILGGHAVKVVGWGKSESGVKYWLLTNSWNYTWGEGGFFKVLRGENECGIESVAWCGIPRMDNDATCDKKQRS